MKINGTLTTKSGSWSQVKKHVDRNWKHDKNEKSINKGLSKFNLHDKNEAINFTNDKLKNRLLKHHYGNYIDDRNAHFKRQGHAKRCQSIDDYLKGKVPTAIGIATAGTLDDKISMKLEINQAYAKRSKAENNKRYYQASSWAMKRYVHGFNRRNPRCPIYHWWTNVDESGAPHVHFAMVPLGYTKLDVNGRPTKATKKAYKSGKRKGQLHRVAGSKPTGDLTKAIEMQFGTNNRRKAFKAWNDQETKAIVRDFGSTFHQRFGKVKDWDTPFERQHTGRKGSLSMNSYKATWAKFDELSRKQNQRKIKQDQREQSQNAREIELSEAESQFTPKRKELDKMNDKLPIIRAQHSDLVLGNRDLTTRNKELSTSNNDLETNIQNKRDKVNSLTRQQNRLQQAVNELKRTRDNIKSYLAKKWNNFKKKHLAGFYNGIKQGLIAVWGKRIHWTDDKWADVAEHGYLIKHKDGSNKRVSGMSLFIKGLIQDGGNKYYKKMKSPANVKKSFEPKPKKENVNLTRSPYWQGFKKYYMNKYHFGTPVPDGTAYLDSLQRYAIIQDEDSYASHHNGNLAGFEFNKTERKINRQVGANPDDPDNYTKPWYKDGTDVDPDDPQK